MTLPLRCDTPDSWGALVADNLSTFLADHAVCERQAALFALNLVAHYPADEELVRRMVALAAEEVTHLRRVVRILHSRNLAPASRRPNPYVQGLHQRIRKNPELDLKIDRLLVGALIEARSCERFTRALAAIEERDREVAELLGELGPAERRHWELFHRLASRECDSTVLVARWNEWLAWEEELALAGGRNPTVHG